MTIREIIRNHQHSSKIVLSKCISDDQSFFEKSSYTSEGISEIKNELAGYQWYFSRTQSHHNIQLNCDIPGYCNISIPNFNAMPYQGVLSISKCFDYAIQAIDCYSNIWGIGDPRALQPIHGDYSLEGNILFNQSKVYVIDWEHFQLACAPLGFDILYMIFELIKMECKDRLPTEKHLSLARKIIAYADSIGVISKAYSDNYFLSFLTEQEKIKFVWKNQYSKLPTSQFSQEQLNKVSKFFSEFYKNPYS
tara:strand:+ start:572 stop:1321 length:750 start_codon:yes stop_codon:yes gene_type:complete